MCTVGDMVRVLQSINPDTSIDEVFKNSTFTRQLKDVINTWPEPSKKTARRILQQSGRMKRRSLPSEEALRSIRRVKSIALPASLLCVYKKWQQEPSTFWNSHGFQIGSKNIYQVYRGMKQLETQRHSGTIIWRFFTLFFFDLMGLLGDGRKYLVETLQDKIVDAIDASGLVNATKLTIQKDLKRWASAGSKYCNIVQKLGDGALMLLPHDVTDNIWENRLPMKGPCFEEAMAHLESLGICETSRKIRSHDLGRRIREIIIRPFRELHQDQSSEEEDNLRKNKSELCCGVESWLVETAESSVQECQILDSSPQLSQLGSGLQIDVIHGHLLTPPGTDWTESIIGTRADNTATESDSASNTQADETFDQNFDVGEYLSFLPNSESSVFSQTLSKDDLMIGDLSQFDVW